jgi:hypothetical protein
VRRVYELTDIDSGNVVGVFNTEAVVLGTVHESFERYARTGVMDLALSEKRPDGSAVLIADGEDLARLTLQANAAELAG